MADLGMKTRTVWILNHYAQNPSGPGGTRHWSLAHHLRQHGWNAVVIAASVELNTGRDRLLAKESCRLERFGEVTFVWLRVPQSQGNGISRIMNMLTFAWRAAVLGASAGISKPDVIVGSSVHPFAALAGWILSIRHRTPFIFEVRDLWPQTLIDFGRIRPKGIPARILRWIERFLYRRADRIISLLPKAIDYIAAQGVPRKKVIWIPNGVEPGDEPPEPKSRDRGYCDFMYFGAHGEANGLENLLYAMAQLQDDHASKHIRLRLIGDGPRKPHLRSLAEELKLCNVQFQEPVPKADIPRVAAEADAFVFNLLDSPVFRFGVSSNKLFDYLAAARPVVFCCSAGNNPVSEAGAGLTVEPNRPDLLCKALRSIAMLTTADRSELGRAGRRWVVANHAFSNLTSLFAGVLGELVAGAHQSYPPNPNSRQLRP